MKKIYYCRAMDGLSTTTIKEEYDFIVECLSEKQTTLINRFTDTSLERLELNRKNAALVVEDNLRLLQQADVVIINFSIPNHTYVGCIGEMILGKIYGKRVIIIDGGSGVKNHFWTIYYSDVVVSDINEALQLI